MHDASRSGLASSVVGIADLGFRRVEEVRVIVTRGHAIAEVTGVTHRYPRTFRVSLASAARLANEGVPCHVEHREHQSANGERR
jgi:hypothetical protein